MSMAASSAFIATSSLPGQAAETSLVAEYRCTGGIAGGGVDLKARMTPQITSGTLNIRWDMSYEGLARFGSPGRFAAGSRLDLDGAVNIKGAWGNQLQVVGGKDQAALQPGTPLELPEGLSHGASIREPGKVELRPGALTIRFTPAVGEWVVNNDSDAITYDGGWTEESTGEEFGDHLNDVHKTSTKGAIAKLTFKGTKVSYIARRGPGLGPVRVLIDGEPVTPQQIEPGKSPEPPGLPLTGTKAQEVLWESPAGSLEYGPHVLEVINDTDAPAYVDAFKVAIGKLEEPPVHDETKCELTKDPGVIEVTLPNVSPSPTDEPTDTNSPDPSPTDSTDDPDPNNPNPDPNDDDPTSQATVGGEHVRVVPQATSSTTPSSTPTSTGPTATKYYRAQVARTPSGGVDTGVAPDEDEHPYGLMAGGMAVVIGSAGSGLLLRRRRAEHAGGAH
ncbi:hypothetical protein [Nonomuraea candida]|uniref:hypothetical protein n=1 Tax=Nonomuraea candida TaxID=359159 RepID=UPI0012FC0546|nr:hypothetical protein [Nonomuraea candida]